MYTIHTVFISVTNGLHPQDIDQLQVSDLGTQIKNYRTGHSLLTARSPEILAPARIPVAAGKKIAKTEKNVSPLKSGPMFSHMIEPERKILHF